MLPNAKIQNKLETPLQYLKGVGPKRAQLLARLDLATVNDLTTYFPARHEDRRHFVAFNTVIPQQRYSLFGRIISAGAVNTGRNTAIFKALLSDNSGNVCAVWYRRTNPKYDVFGAMQKKITPGAQIIIHGVSVLGRSGIEIMVDDFEIIPQGNPMPVKSLNIGRIVPIYGLTEGLDAKWLRNLIWNTLNKYLYLTRDFLPVRTRLKQDLPSRHKAVFDYHFPNSTQDLEKARKRLAFEEFFLVETVMAQIHYKRRKSEKGLIFNPTRLILTPFREKLGFEFTRAQAKAINDIFRDMSGGISMNRLLQGDVGSGKTVVALSAMLLAAENGYQSALVAPTEILAEQHALTFEKFLKDLPVKFECITSATPGGKKEGITRGLLDGSVNVLIGTHAILEESVQFTRLGLVIVDEQHRFGVRQRLRLQEKGNNPHVLVMTATPIPRSLALTLYGDLDLSVIGEMPPGRRPAKTVILQETEAWDEVLRELKCGKQAYIVYPIIDESEKIFTRTGRTIKALMPESEKISEIFRDFNIGILHGRLPYGEKIRIMDDFRKRKTEVLLATPVIEIGIDVPGANVIAIMHPERFGLSQLHQLRGRVGRSPDADSTCVLIVDDRNNLGAETLERLETFCKISDGFRLADADLGFRGPGELFGETQHGIPEFKVARLGSDNSILANAREAAFNLVDSDPELKLPENTLLANEIKKKFLANACLGGVG